MKQPKALWAIITAAWLSGSPNPCSGEIQIITHLIRFADHFLILCLLDTEFSGRWEMQLSNQVRLWRRQNLPRVPLFPLRWARSSLPLMRRRVRVEDLG
jgi:hypothetical protein